MNDYIELCRLSACLDSLPTPYGLGPLHLICLTVVSPRYTDQFLSFLFFFFFSFLFYNQMHLFKVQRQHPPSPLHSRQLKSQQHEIITTFPNSTPSHGFVLGGGDIPPLLSPSLRFIPLGFLYSGLMDFVFF